MGFALIILCLANVWVVRCNTQCYNQLGCFPNGSPWRNLLRPVPKPDSPMEVNTTFYFSNRANIAQTYVKTWPRIEIPSGYDFHKPTFVITHGFNSKASAKWVLNMTESLLSTSDGNVFAVDWRNGARLNYFQAVSNTRITGAEVARFVNYLIANESADPGTIHLLGHSLGAHIMGYGGKNITDLGRITAMDPAQPFFQGQPAEIVLNKSDANFVDIVHTDGKPLLGLGMSISVGTVDFFVNGGETQPNCILDDDAIDSLLSAVKWPIEVIYNLAACDHGRSTKYMASAIRGPCVMWGHRYNATVAHLRYTDFVIDWNCSASNCTAMGLDTVRYPAIGNFAVKTSGTYPFCLEEASSNEAMRGVISERAS